MVKKLSKCILLNKVKSANDNYINVVKYGHARNLLSKKKECLIIDKNLNAEKIADKKIFIQIKNDLDKSKTIKNLEIVVKANKSGTLYESLTIAKIMHILKSKKKINNPSIFSAKLESSEKISLTEIKSIGDYNLLLFHSQEEIVCIHLQIVVAIL